MAQKKKLMDTVDELIERGEGKITSLTGLATKLNELDGRQTMKSWRRTLRGYRTRNADEDTIALIARAFGVERDELPEAAARPTLAGLSAHLESLAEKVEHLLATEVKLTKDLADARTRISRLERARKQSQDAAKRQGTTG